MCESCGELFTKALNELLASEGNSYRIGGAAFVFWTREETGFSLRSFMDRPDAEEVRALMASVQTGKSAAPDETAFYAAALSGSGGRAVVRDWIDTTVADVKRSLARWFRMRMPVLIRLTQAAGEWPVEVVQAPLQKGGLFRRASLALHSKRLRRYQRSSV